MGYRNLRQTQKNEMRVCLDALCTYRDTANTNRAAGVRLSKHPSLPRRQYTVEPTSAMGRRRVACRRLCSGTIHTRVPSAGFCPRSRGPVARTRLNGPAPMRRTNRRLSRRANMHTESMQFLGAGTTSLPRSLSSRGIAHPRRRGGCTRELALSLAPS